MMHVAYMLQSITVFGFSHSAAVQKPLHMATYPLFRRKLHALERKLQLTNATYTRSQIKTTLGIKKCQGISFEEGHWDEQPHCLSKLGCLNGLPSCLSVWPKVVQLATEHMPPCYITLIY